MTLAPDYGSRDVSWKDETDLEGIPRNTLVWGIENSTDSEAAPAFKSSVCRLGDVSGSQ